MELPLTYVLADMEAVGIAADTDGLLALQAELGAGVKAVEQDAHQLVGREFNLGSPKQLQEILFDQFAAAEDQADQDRLHDRRRLARRPLRRRPSTRCWSCCCGTARSPGSRRSSTACCR